MSDVERRLLRASRELREVAIEPPPFASLSAPAARRPSGLMARLPALVMPVLFVIGGLAVVAGGVLDPEPITSDVPAAGREVGVEPQLRGGIPANVELPTEPSVASAASSAVLTPRQEIALISSLGSDARPQSPGAGGRREPPLRRYR